MLKKLYNFNPLNIAKCLNLVQQTTICKFSHTNDTKNEAAVKEIEIPTKKKSFKSKNSLAVEFPKLEPNVARKIKTIVSLNVSKDLVTWMVVDINGNILEWNHVAQEHLFNDFSKLNFETDFNQLKSTFERYVPKECSVYLFETRKYKAVDAKYVPLMIKINRFEIMIQCIIKTYLEQHNQSARIFNLSRLNVGKKFRIVVGNERVLSSDVVNFILKKQINVDYMFLNQMALKCPDEFEEHFKKVNNSQIKESIAKNYLQCACFVKTVKDCLNNKNQ